MADTSPPLPRAQFPVAERWVYLNHAAVAPLPRVAVEAARGADDAWMREGSEACDAYDERIEEVRAAAAALVGATPAEVAFVKNTTEGLAFVAAGLTWQPGDRVVVPDHEYPSTIFPFLALEDQGVEIVRIDPVGPHGELPLEHFERALADGGVRLVALSWVQYGTGWRTDLAALAELTHRHDALLCVDVIQGLGLVPCDLTGWGVDVAMADGHKWMLGPQGEGVLYVAQRHLDAGTFRVLEPGWNAVVTRDDYDILELSYDPTARRYEGGTHNVTGIVAMGASLDLLAAAGTEPVWRHVDTWCQHAADQLEAIGAGIVTTRDPGHRAGILTFTIEGHTGDELHAALAAQGVACRPRVGGVRVSPHGWNDDDDLARFLAAVPRPA